MPPTMPVSMPSCEDTHLALAVDVLRHFGELQFVAQGSSMIPSIYPGDLLIVRSQALADARRGQIVLCLCEGRLRAHRLTRKWRDANRVFFTTQGDALPDEDPSTDESHMLGYVTGLVRYGEPVDVARINSPRIKLLGWGVRHSDSLAKALLRGHSLRIRLLGNSRDLAGNPATQSRQCA